MRFDTVAAVQAWAKTVAAEDHARHMEHGIDFNPYSTYGRRNDWKRGYDNAPPRQFEITQDFDLAYQRGKAYREHTT